MHYDYLNSPLGTLTLCCEDDHLEEIRFGKQPPENAEHKSSRTLDAAARQLKEYFAGERQTFDLPLSPRGTEFQRQVWRQLQAIPYGETRSYQWQASRMGKPRATRAVGAANGRNPIPIVIPCHRVIGSNGKLTGYAGGLHIKQQLLRIEGCGL